MTSKLLDKTKVQEALREAKNNIRFRSQVLANLSLNPIEAFELGIDSDSIRYAIHEESKMLIKEAFELFVDELIWRLDSCEPDRYPCALCHEERNEEST